MEDNGIFETVIIVDEDSKKEFLEKAVDSSIFIFSLENLMNNADICVSETFSSLEALKNALMSAQAVYIIPFEYLKDENILFGLIDILKIKQYYAFDYDIESVDTINSALQHSALVSRDTVRGYIAEFTVAKFFKCRVTKILQWFFDKEELASNKDIATLSITYPALIALSKIVQTEERIENFVPEKFKRVGVVYEYQEKQFIARNSKRFSKKYENELDLFLRQVSNPKNMHIVQDFKRETKNLTPPEPLNSHSLERLGVTRFGFSIDYTMKIASQLREGKMLIKEKKVGPLISNIYTSKKNINAESVIDISQYIIDAYGEDYVHSTGRGAKEDKNENTSHKEAIRPMYFSKEFSPKELKPFLTEDQYKIYSLIFYRSIAFFMVDAIVDISNLVVRVEADEFKLISNVIHKDDLQNDYEGWLKIGAFLGSDEADSIDADSSLPDSLYSGQEFTKEDGEILEFKTYTSNERNPARYGEGRLKAALIKNGLLPKLSGTSSINQLKAQKIAFPSSGTLHPSEIGKKIFYTLEEHADWIFDEEFIQNYVSSLDAINLGEMTKEDVMEVFYLKEAQFKTSIGYKESIKSNEPEEWLLNKAKKIANQLNQKLSENMLSNRKELFSFIEQNDPELEKLGRCKKCNKGEIYEREKGFFCNNPQCSFVLWRNMAEGFFKHFKKHIPSHDIKEVLKVILENKKCNIDGFIKTKTFTNKDKEEESQDVSFSADITVVFDEKYKNWKIDFFREYSVENKKNEEQEYEDKKENIKKEIKEIAENKRRLKEIAITDVLTRALNQTKYTEDMRTLFKSKEKNKVLLAFLDIDHFKNVNDTYGHDAGDAVLSKISDMFHNITRELEMVVYRKGGEEFCIISKEDSHKSLETFETIRAAIENTPIDIGSQEIKITISIGVARGIGKNSSDDLTTCADEYMYRAKRNGRNQVVIESLEDAEISMLERELHSHHAEVKELHKKATIDGLTNVNNRVQYENDLHDLKQENKFKDVFVAFFDADHFKNVNDTYGHDTGDVVLQNIASNISDIANSKTMKCYRIGGEEFVLISTEDKSTTLLTLEKIRAVQEGKVIEHKGDSLSITLSIGMAFGKEVGSIEELVSLADSRQYVAKKNGRNRVVYNEEVNQDEFLPGEELNTPQTITSVEIRDAENKIDTPLEIDDSDEETIFLEKAIKQKNTFFLKLPNSASDKAMDMLKNIKTIHIKTEKFFLIAATLSERKIRALTTELNTGGICAVCSQEGSKNIALLKDILNDEYDENVKQKNIKTKEI